MNILFVCEHEIHFGGVGEVVKHLANGLKSHGHKCFIYTNCFVPAELPFPVDGVRNGPLAKPARITAMKELLSNHKASGSLKKAIADFQIDVVHCHEVNLALFTALVGSTKPAIVTSHGDIYNKRYDKPRIRKAYMKRLAKLYCATALNADMKNRFVAVFDKSLPVEIIPNGISSTWLDAPLSSRKDILLAAGRFSKDKKMDVCIEAYSRSSIRKSVPLVIIGDGQENENLVMLARQCGLTVETSIAGPLLPDRLYLPGYIEGDEKLGLFSRCLAFLHPSGFEAFGIVILEALARGGIVIANDLKTYHSQFDGKNLAIGYVANNAPEAWVAELDKLANLIQQGLLPDVSLSVEACRDFSWDNIFMKYLECYRQASLMQGNLH